MIQGTANVLANKGGVEFIKLIDVAMYCGDGLILKSSRRRYYCNLFGL